MRTEKHWKVLTVSKWLLSSGMKTAIIIVIILTAVNLFMINRFSHKIGNAEDLTLSEIDCIMILGAGVWGADRPSYILKDRLDKGLALYELGVSDRLLMSGDHGRETYDEVNVMKDYATEEGIDTDLVFMDHAGFSTYESMVRAKKVFEVESMVIVTQEYHLYRAVYIANRLGIDAYGVPARTYAYRHQWLRNLREQVARAKDMVWLMLQMPPKYLGDVIPITGSGSLTDDRNQ